MNRRLALLSTALLAFATASAAADGPIRIDIKAQAFTPAEIHIPAGVKVELRIVNDDDLPAEFESTDFSREIVVPGHREVKLFIGPLQPGRYRFFNDFHQESEGWVVVGAAK
jgi:plastocyanin